MARHADWPERLAAFVAARKAVPFAFGTADCGMLAADWILEATGTDPVPDLRGRYRSVAGSVAVVRRTGCACLTELVTKRVGPPLAPLLAQRGDIVELPGDDGPALGICIGIDAVAMAPEGLVTVPMANAVRAWRV